MSQDPHFDDQNPYARERDDNPYASDSGGTGPQSPPRGLSKTAKVMIALAIGGGLLIVTCCGAGGWLAMKVQNAATEDPQEIQAIRESMFSQIELPDGMNPQVGVGITLFGQGLQFVVYGAGEDATRGPVLVMFQLPPGQNAKEMERQMKESLGRKQEIKVESSETKTLTIDGQMREFTFSKCKWGDTGIDVRQVTGVFEGKQGLVLVDFVEPEELWVEEDVVKMLESIKK